MQKIFPITRAQRVALFKLFQRDFPSWVTPYRRRRWSMQPDVLVPVSSHAFQRFRKTVRPTFGCDGAVTIPWKGMWLCIERDGYTHS